jgi:hypothetical protein
MCRSTAGDWLGSHFGGGNGLGQGEPGNDLEILCLLLGIAIWQQFQAISTMALAVSARMSRQEDRGLFQVFGGKAGLRGLADVDMQ